MSFKYDAVKRKEHYLENIKRSKFYNSIKWKKFRDWYISKVGGYCEKCKDNGIIRAGDNLHHIIHLTEENVGNAALSINEKNVVYLCFECHNKEHNRDFMTQAKERKQKMQEKRQYKFDKNGNLIKNEKYKGD